MMPLLAGVPLATAVPGATDFVGVLPEVIVAGGFLCLMLLDLWVPASRRTRLAGFSVLVLLGALGVTVWGWFDAGASGHTVYFGAFA